ncbi:MAG: GNAT family N-acetyltransferase [Candidatus Daviesbacteria bacterium]
MEITVKKSADAEKAYQIAQTLPGYFNAQGLKDIKKSTRDEILYGAYIGEEMIGFVTYEEENQYVVELSWVAILEKYQGQNIGTKLVQDSLKEVGKFYKICKVKTLAETQPDSGYEKTRNFYKKLGFIPLEIIDPYPDWGKDSPCQIFVKVI